MLNTLKIIEDVCIKKSYTYAPQYIHKYEISDVNLQITDIEKQLQKYEGEDDDFKCNHINIEQLSNFLKQRSALEKVIEMDNGSDENYYMIIEDDCTIIPEFIKNFEEFLENPKISLWDMLFLSIPNNSNEYEFKDTRSLVKILPSKDIYCISPKCAKRILPLLQKIMGSYRMQLSYIIHTNTDIISLCSTKNVSIEGSKAGFFPSSSVENNLLIYNNMFIEMFNLLEKENIDIDIIEKYSKSVDILQSPEMMHIYGVLLYKIKDHIGAKAIFEKAIDQMILKNGMLNKRSELLNNTIAINAFCQAI